MGFVALVFSMAVVGVIVGGLARFALPGPDPLSLWWTSALGVAGTVLGALLGKALFGTSGSLLLAVLVAIAILAVYRRIKRHRLPPAG